MVAGLTAEERARYARHLTLAEIGEAGQLRLKRASVLIVGVGGLGSPAALYLAAAGIGRLGLVDADRVELSNLQRQILFRAGDAGREKVDVGSERLIETNPAVVIEARAERLTPQNAGDLVPAHDVILDGSDNFETKALVSDAAVAAGKPLVQASVSRFAGEIATWLPGGPCYRCVYPETAHAPSSARCADAGVLGAMPGVMGTLQALEALKICLGIGESLAGRLLRFDGLSMRFKEIRVARDPRCRSCSNVSAWSASSGRQAPRPSPGPVREISPTELEAWLRAGEPIVLLDVREPEEHAIARLSETLIPLGTLTERWGELDPAKRTVVYCHHGVRSRYAAEFLASKGFVDVINLRGGIDAWSRAVDPNYPRY